jgi:hypothetical protein
MPIDFRQSVFLSDDCTYIGYRDNTGNYDAVTNPGGWGAPNPTRISSGGYVRITNVCSGEQIVPLIYPITADNYPAIFAALGSEENFQSMVFYPTFLAYFDQNYNFWYDNSVTEVPDGLYHIETIILSGEEYDVIGDVDNYILSTCALDCTIAQLAYESLMNPCNESVKVKYQKVLAYRQVMDYLMDCENYSGVCSAWEKINLLLDNKGGCGCGC